LARLACVLASFFFEDRCSYSHSPSHNGVCRLFPSGVKFRPCRWSAEFFHFIFFLSPGRFFVPGVVDSGNFCVFLCRSFFFFSSHDRLMRRLSSFSRRFAVFSQRLHLFLFRFPVFVSIVYDRCMLCGVRLFFFLRTALRVFPIASTSRLPGRKQAPCHKEVFFSC